MSTFDMELTEERLDEIKKLLIRLYADQTGMEVKSVKIKPEKRKIKETT